MKQKVQLVANFSFDVPEGYKFHKKLTGEELKRMVVEAITNSESFLFSENDEDWGPPKNVKVKIIYL